MKKLKKILVAFFLGNIMVFSQNQLTPDEKVYFDSGKFVVKESEKLKLFKLFGETNNTYSILLVGYTDPRGSVAYNMQLSLNRAKAIHDFLQKSGLKLGKVEFIGKGILDVTVGSKDIKEHRRVEIYIENGNTSVKVDGFDHDARTELSKTESELNIRIIELEKQAFERDEKLKKIEIDNRVNDSLDLVRKIVKNVEFADIKDFDKEIKKGDEIVFKNILFEENKPILINSSQKDLDKLLDIMNNNPNLKIEVQGHVCCGVPKNKNEIDFVKALSTSRAKAVHDFLLKNDIAPERIVYKGLSFDQPLVYPEKNRSDQAINRRVQVMVLEK